jgi:hypothetical protein
VNERLGQTCLLGAAYLFTLLRMFRVKVKGKWFAKKRRSRIGWMR